MPPAAPYFACCFWLLGCQTLRVQELLDKSDAEDMDANAAALEDMYALPALCPLPSAARTV